MYKAARWLMVLALMVSIGLHTAAIQSAAWASMLVSYSLQKGSVAQAVADTFDGEHPCPLCKLAQKTSQPGDENSTPNPTQEDAFKLKFHLVFEPHPVVVIQTLPQPTLRVTEPATAEARATSPDTPPPRHTLHA